MIRSLVLSLFLAFTLAACGSMGSKSGSQYLGNWVSEEESVFINIKKQDGVFLAELGENGDMKSVTLELQENGCLKHNRTSPDPSDIKGFTLCFNTDKGYLDFENEDNAEVIFVKSTK